MQCKWTIHFVSLHDLISIDGWRLVQLLCTVFLSVVITVWLHLTKKQLTLELQHHAASTDSAVVAGDIAKDNWTVCHALPFLHFMVI